MTEQSSIAEAVHSLGRSVELAQEASGHILAAQPRLTNVYSLYATAFWPSDAGSAEKSKKRIDEAIKSINVAIEALGHATQSIADFVEEVAPRLKLSQNPHLQIQPSGEELPEASIRPRTLGGVVDTFILSSEDISGVLHFAGDGTHGVIDIFHPPDASGYPAGVQAPQSTPQPPSHPAAAAGDPVLTAVVTTLLITKAAHYGAVLALKRLFGGRKS